MEAKKSVIVSEANGLSRAVGKPVLLLLLAPEDCGDTQSFLPMLNRVKAAFDDALIVSECKGSHRNRNGNHQDLKDALEHFSYDKIPGDEGGNQRGHFPSGALYFGGQEVYRLPSDSVLAAMPAKALADEISRTTGVSYDAKILHARADIAHGGQA